MMNPIFSLPKPPPLSSTSNLVANEEHRFTLGPTSNNNASQIFRSKTERLDWRQIASIDLDALLHSTSEDDLKNLLGSRLLSQIAYCSIDQELAEHDKPSPGFLKVFQLAQLFIELLLHVHHIAYESQQQLEARCTKLEAEAQTREKEIRMMREALSVARKELKKRKEMLNVTQNEMIGAENKDEYDQCPYCSKKFIAQIYLLSHMQRRHQGLPLHPIFARSINFPAQAQHTQRPRVHFEDMATSMVQVVTMSTQTEAAVSEITSTPREKDVNSNLQKEKQDQETQSERKQIQETSVLPAGTIKEDVEEVISRMKRDMDAQWVQLANRIQETGIEELKHVMMDEIHKMQDMMTSRALVRTNEEREVKVDRSEAAAINKVDSSVVQELEERFKRQEKELEELRNQLKVKMQEDTVTFDGKLQAQERFWRMKLRQVEEAYEEQAARLRDEIKTAMTANTKLSTADAYEKSVQQTQTSKSDDSSGEEDETESRIRVQPVETSTPVRISTPDRMTKIRPMTARVVRTKSQEPLKQSQTPKSPKAVPRSPQPMTSKAWQEPGNVVHGAYEDLQLPHGRRTLQEEDDTIDEVSDYESSDEEEQENDDDDIPDDGQSESEVEVSEAEVEDVSESMHKNESNRPVQETLQQQSELEATAAQMRQIRERVLLDVNRKMKELGLVKNDGNETRSLRPEDMTKAIVELKRRRQSLESALKDPQERERMRTQLFMATPTVEYETSTPAPVVGVELESPSHNLSHRERPLTPSPSHQSRASISVGRSPIAKMLSAVKNKGTGWKNRMVTSFKRKKSQPPARRRPRTPSTPTSLHVYKMQPAA